MCGVRLPESFPQRLSKPNHYYIYFAFQIFSLMKLKEEIKVNTKHVEVQTDHKEEIKKEGTGVVVEIQADAKEDTTDSETGITALESKMVGTEKMW